MIVSVVETALYHDSDHQLLGASTFSSRGDMLGAFVSLLLCCFRGHGSGRAESSHARAESTPEADSAGLGLN